jgi:hypothetical protein
MLALGTWLTYSSCELQTPSSSDKQNNSAVRQSRLVGKLLNKWCSRCFDDQVAIDAQMCDWNFNSNTIPAGEGAGLTCFQRNCVFGVVGFVMLYATHSLQVPHFN